MIYYYHYNNKGSHPFAKDWTSEENIAMAELNEEQAGFLVETAHEIMRRSKRSYELPLVILLVLTSIIESEFKDIRQNEDFEHDFYFVAQLYDMDWKPSFTI